MKGVTQEQIAYAKQMNLLSYLKTYEPQELIKVGREYKTRTHDSLRISENGKWNWCSQGFGGTTALNYLIRVKGMDFVSAVRWMNELSPGAVCIQPVNEQETEQAERRPFEPPVPDQGAESVTAYLRKREIRAKVLNYCRAEGILYQTTRGSYKNCVFTGKDPNGNLRSAFIRGCKGSFRGDVSGSEKRYGFCIPAEDAACKLVEVYEAPIDAMSGASFRVLKNRPTWRSVNYLSLGGLNYQALEGFLEGHPQTKEIRLCLDNDEPGRTFAGKLKELYEERGFKVSDTPPPFAKDYNEALVRYVAKLRERTIAE